MERLEVGAKRDGLNVHYNFFFQLNYLIGPRLSGVLYTLNDDFKSSQNSANCRNSYAKKHIRIVPLNLFFY